MATADRILELAQKAEFLYKSQDREEQRRLLEIVLSNCTFDRGSLSPTYNSPFDHSCAGTKVEIGGEVGFVPVEPAHINNLGQFSIAQIARNAQNLSIRL